MKPVGKYTLMAASAILLLSANIFALEIGALHASIQPIDAGHTCHRLMTDEECSAYLSTLAGLPAGDQRKQFLDAHEDMMRERETACSCSRLNADPTVLYPTIIQVALPG